MDPFEPQACGLGRIFPCWVQPPNGEGRGFVEMPYTLPQDFTLFVLLKQASNAIWRRKLDWIAERGGMALIKTHPDYMVFPGGRKRIDGYPVELYSDFLKYLRERYGDEAWFAQPSEVAAYWRRLLQPDNSAGIHHSLPQDLLPNLPRGPCRRLADPLSHEGRRFPPRRLRGRSQL